MTLATDATLLFRVLSNLVANSLRYTESGGILVACRRRGNVAKIEVWDSGIGIPAEQHERIFEEFYQLNNPARDRTRGLGLGLATVRRIVQLLGHPLWLRSTVGKGSRFTIEVPIADPTRVQSVVATIEQKVPNLIGGKLIVVIDDEESVRLGMQSLLESWGCKCITAMDRQKLCAASTGGARRTSSSPTCVCAAKARASMRSASCAPSSATRFPPCSSRATPLPSSCARSAPRG